MIKKLLTSLLLVSAVLTLSAIENPKIDPHHLASGGYGYLISQGDKCDVWWAEGAYKVMKDAPLPSKRSKGIEMWSAKNEWESFMVVLRPGVELQNVKFEFSALNDKQSKISADQISIRKVEYVNVTHPTDYYGFKGAWPDPLPLYKTTDDLAKGVNQPFWISIKTPTGTKAGQYKGLVKITAQDWVCDIPIELNVWDFELPATPKMRSGFGMNMKNITRYNNLKTQEQKEEVFEHYMRSMADYKVSPYNPFEFAPIEEKIEGVDWEGGFYDSKTKHSGKYSYMVVDNAYDKNTEATMRSLLSIEGNKAYDLQWWAKSKAETQEFVVGVECYDGKGELIWFENRFEVFSAKGDWGNFKLPLGKLSANTKSVKVRLFPTKRTAIGEGTGIVWFDDITITSSENTASAKQWTQGEDGAGKNSNTGVVEIKDNLLLSGGFEADINKIGIKLNFTKFNKAAKRYLGEYGFNSFVLRLKGLGGGTYYSRKGGVFEGFAQGTEEYNKLMERYLKQIESNLEKEGILGHEYIYWFDEPGEADYPFVHETNAMIKRYAPKLTTFLTEHVAGQDISDVTDISCTIWHKLNHEKVKKMTDKKLEYWSYLCCWPKSPWISEFIDHDTINFRMWLWASYVHDLSGILIWETTYWNSPEATPIDKLQNPWDQAMSWVNGYGWIQGKQTIWGNGDGRMFYPENRDVNNDSNTYTSEAIPSVRLEILRDGMEDFEYLHLLEDLIKNSPKSKHARAKRAAKLLEIPKSIYTDEQTYTKDPQVLLKYRQHIAKAILSLQK